MSDQRKMRSELKQGLHQFLMQLYTFYSQTMSEDDAKKAVAECIQEQYQYFFPEGIDNNQTKEALTDKVKELTDKLNESRTFDSQMYYAERIDSLTAVIELFDTN